MSIHVFGLTVTALVDASRAARVVDHPISFVDDTSRVMVIVDQSGRVALRPADRGSSLK
jgi:hypothetical protein